MFSQVVPAPDEAELCGDSKYRRYVEAMDKTLRNFEYYKEWTELINSLSKINKLIQSNHRYHVIPRRAALCKRLSQCMHPSLPPGVHLKVLEAYDIIFKCIGPERLADELHLYSAGLYPVLTYCKSSVRPAVMDLYENFLIVLGPRMKPSLCAFLSGSLPAVEETSDHFNRMLTLLDSMSRAVGRSFFYGALWKVILENPDLRVNGLIFISERYNRRLTLDAQTFFMGTDVDVLVSSLCACLTTTGNDAFVQRMALDFLLAAFPLHANQHLVRDDSLRLATAALGTLNRRDLALDKRLFSWFLGTQEVIMTSPEVGGRVKRPYPTMTPQPQSLPTLKAPDAPLDSKGGVYFESYGKPLLLDAIRIVLSEGWSQMTDARSYRIVTTVLEKADIGDRIVDDLFLDIIRSAYHASSRVDSLPSDSKAYQEMVLGVTLLFRTLGPAYVWRSLANLFKDSCAKMNASEHLLPAMVQDVGGGIPTAIEICLLIRTLLKTLRWSGVDALAARPTTDGHLPNLMAVLMDTTRNHLDILSLAQVSEVLATVQAILVCLHPLPPVGIGVFSLFGSSPYTTLGTNREAKKHRRLPSTGLVSSLHGPVKAFKAFFAAVLNEVCLPGVDVSAWIGAMLFPEGQSISGQDEAAGHEQEEMMKQLDCILRGLNLKLCRKQTCVSPALLTEGKVQALKDRVAEFQGMRKRDSSAARDQTELVVIHSVACDILVHLADAFASCQEDFVLNVSAEDILEDQEFLPPWFSSLVLCTLVSPFAMISKSVQTLSFLFSRTSPSSPFLSTLLMKRFLDKTVLLQTLVDELWDHLSSLNASVDALDSAKLILLLQSSLAEASSRDQLPRRPLVDSKRSSIHSLSSLSSLVEKRLCQRISTVGREAEGIDKFNLLWHCAVERRSASGGVDLAPPRLEKCCLIILEYLNSSVGFRRSLAENWLLRSFQQGHAQRVLDPLLMILLAPSSARICVKYMTIKRETVLEQTGSKSCPQEFLYVLTTVGGCVVHHTTKREHLRSKRVDISRRLLEEAASRRAIILTGAGEELVTGGEDDFEEDSAFDESVMLSLDTEEDQSPSTLRKRTRSLRKSESLNDMVGFFEEDSACERSRSATLHEHKRKEEEDGRMIPLRQLSRTESEPCLQSGRQGLFQGSSLKTMATTLGHSNDSFEGDLRLEAEAVVNTIMEDVFNLAWDIIQEGLEPSGARCGPMASMPAKDDEEDDEDQGLVMKVNLRKTQSSNIPNSRGEQLDTAIHPLHSHLLIYPQVIDSARIMHCLSLLRTILTSRSTDLTFSTLVSASLGSSPSSSRGQQIQALLARHRMSLQGQSFNGSLPVDLTTAFRSTTLIDVITGVCFHLLRSYYPALDSAALTFDERRRNLDVQLSAADLLTSLFNGIRELVVKGSVGLTSFVSDLLTRCLAQKVTLRSLWISLCGMVAMDRDSPLIEDFGFTGRLLQLNVEGEGKYWEVYQSHCLRVLESLVILEHHLGMSDGSYQSPLKVPSNIHWSASRRAAFAALDSGAPLPPWHFVQGCALVRQPMFLQLLGAALKERSLRSFHSAWLSVIITCLPYLGKSLKQVVLIVIAQICLNLEELSKTDSRYAVFPFPVDYPSSLLSALSTIVHFCLGPSPSGSPPSPSFDSAVSLAWLPFAHQLPQTSTRAGSPISNKGSNIFSNLISAFTPSGTSKAETTSSTFNSDPEDPLVAARIAVLRDLPRILSAVSCMWEACRASHTGGTSSASGAVATSAFPLHPLGSKQQRQQLSQAILEFLGSLSHSNPVSFLAAIGVAWEHAKQELDKPDITRVYGGKNSVSSCPELTYPISDAQKTLVTMLQSLRVFPLELLVQTLKAILKQPPAVDAPQRFSLDLSLLELFHSYISLLPGNAISEGIPPILSLLKEAPSVSAKNQFWMFLILSHLVQKLQTFSGEKKRQKEIQEVTSKLIESLGSVAGACLEQSSWIFRSQSVVSVKKLADGDLADDADFKRGSIAGSTGTTADQESHHTMYQRQTSCLQSLNLLASHLAPILDVVYGSEEKEKILTILSSLLVNVFPYLRNHRRANMPFYAAGSAILSGLSGYGHTRKAWKKECLDLFLDPAFFQADMASLLHWKTIIDNLMAHETTAFKDLLNRFALSSSGSLAIFTSKEAEWEHRAANMKRLAFILFASENDQYCRYMADIQDRLSECLRLPSLVVSASCFLLFRLLILRTSSPPALSALWPTLNGELVQVFLLMHGHLNRDSNEFRQRSGSSHLHRMSELEPQWLTNPSNGLAAAPSHPAWLSLYLSASKLLDLLLALPPHRLPQFQTYRWLFLGEGVAIPPSLMEPIWRRSNSEEATKETEDVKNPKEDYSEEKNQEKEKLSNNGMEFISHAEKLALALERKFPEPVHPLTFQVGKLMLVNRSLITLGDLKPFFITLARGRRYQQPMDPLVPEDDILKGIEENILRDFVEPCTY